MSRIRVATRLVCATGLLAAFGVTQAAAAADPAGAIEICRVSVAGDQHLGKEIVIPQGATFGDGGAYKDGQRTGIYWPLWIAMTERVTIAKDAKCVTGKARVMTNLDKHPVRRADGRAFVPSGTAVKPREDWPADFDVAATVATDFK